jgi:hypothetical protein
VERLGPVGIAPGECHVGGLGLDRVLLQLRFGRGERRTLRQQVRFELPHSGPELLLVELRQDLTGRHDLVDVHVQLLDDAVRFRLHLDFRDRFHLPGRDHRPDHRAALDGCKPGRIDGHRRAFQRGVAPGACNQEPEDGGGQNRTFALLHVVLVMAAEVPGWRRATP